MSRRKSHRPGGEGGHSGVPAEPDGVERRSEQPRRAHPRIDAPAVAVEGDWCTVRDISVGGVSVDQAAPLASGDRYTLILNDLILDEMIELTGEVVWSRDGQAGLRWIGLTGDQEAWLEKRSQEWKEDSLLAQLAQVLTTNAPIQDETAAAEAPLAAPAAEAASASHAWPEEPAAAASHAPPTGIAAPEAARRPWAAAPPAWSGQAGYWTPWALAVVTVTLFLGLVIDRLAHRPQALIPAAAAAEAEPPPFTGAWVCRKGDAVQFTEIYNPDGTWYREIPSGSTLNGHWLEKDGLITVNYIGWDYRTRKQSLATRYRWWSPGADGGAPVLTFLRPDGSLDETARLTRQE